jgi:hypothetical protein
MKLSTLFVAVIGLLLICPSSVDAQKKKRGAGSRQSARPPHPPKKEATTPQVESPIPAKSVRIVEPAEPNELDRLRGAWDLKAEYAEKTEMTVSRTSSGFFFSGGGTTVREFKNWNLNGPDRNAIAIEYGDHVITLKYDAQSKNYLLTAKADKVANLPNNFPLAYSDKEGFVPLAPLPQLDQKPAAQTGEQPVKPAAKSIEEAFANSMAAWMSKPSSDPRTFQPKIIFNASGGHTWFIAPDYKIEFKKKSTPMMEILVR